MSYSFRPKGCYSSCYSDYTGYFCGYFNTHSTGNGEGTDTGNDQYIHCRSSDNGMGGTYSPSGTNRAANAQAACESHCGTCTTSMCGGCNNKGWRCASQHNCNQAFVWVINAGENNMGCGWSTCALDSDDSMDWYKESSTCSI